MTRQNPGSKLKKLDNKKPVKGQSKGGLEKKRESNDGDMQFASGLKRTSNYMPTTPDPLEEFLRKVAPLLQMYQSLEFACVAARHRSGWILISGKAALSTDPCDSETKIVIVPVIPPQEIVALQGYLPVERVNDLVANLGDSWVVRDLNVRLPDKKAGGFSWSQPDVIKLWKPFEPQGSRALALDGKGRAASSLLSYSILEEIDNHLRLSTPAFNGFDGLCYRLGLPVRRSNLTSSFRVSAELPARVLEVRIDPSKRELAISISCIGAPNLMVDWFPKPGLKMVPDGWIREHMSGVYDVLLPVPDGAWRADLILSYGEIEAQVSTVYIEAQYAGGKAAGLIPLEVVEKEPPVSDPATREAPNQEYGRSKPTNIDKRSKLTPTDKDRRRIVQRVKREGGEAGDKCEALDLEHVPLTKGPKWEPYRLRRNPWTDAYVQGGKILQKQIRTRFWKDENT